MKLEGSVKIAKKWLVAGLCMSTALLISACQRPASDGKPKPDEAPPLAQPGDTSKAEAFLTTSLAIVPNRTVTRTFGFECRLFTYSGHGDYVERFQGALAGLEESAKKKGANAFINMRVAAVGYEAQGSKWSSSVVNICGDLVVLK